MSHQSDDHCVCSTHAYDPSCPNAFTQNGQVLHLMSRPIALKQHDNGKCEDQGQEFEDRRPPLDTVADLEEQIRVLKVANREGLYSSRNPVNVLPSARVMPDDSQDNRSGSLTAQRGGRQPMYTSSEGLRLGADATMDRFRPLTVNGISMTEAAIGGFRLDPRKLSEVAANVIPLPPAVLPIIFMDNDLNFSHHFFNGLEIAAGREFIIRIAKSGRYSAADGEFIGPLIRSLATSGYKESDTDLEVFVKTVLSATFSTGNVESSNIGGEVLIVQSNFYGFQYIECGLQCREADLKMWLHTAYTQYMLSWFNAFKSSGIPEFALDGVLDRYEHRSNVKYSEKTMSTQDVANSGVVELPDSGMMVRRVYAPEKHKSKRSEPKEVKKRSSRFSRRDF